MARDGHTFRLQCTADSGGYTMKWRRVKPKPSWRLLCSSSVRGPCQGRGRPEEHPSLGPRGSCGSTGRWVSGFGTHSPKSGLDGVHEVPGTLLFLIPSFLSHSSAQPLPPLFFPLNPPETPLPPRKKLAAVSQVLAQFGSPNVHEASTVCLCLLLSSFLPLHKLTHAHTHMQMQTHPHRFMYTEHTKTPSCPKCTLR